MSETKARNAVIRCIKRVVVPRMWESGYVDHNEPHGHVMLWCPKKPKKFSTNEKLREVIAITKTGISDDAEGGGMTTHDMSTLPVADLANVLEWLLSIDFNAVSRCSPGIRK